jgi:hypothetical protein
MSQRHSGAVVGSAFPMEKQSSVEHAPPTQWLVASYPPRKRHEVQIATPTAAIADGSVQFRIRVRFWPDLAYRPVYENFWNWLTDQRGNKLVNSPFVSRPSLSARRSRRFGGKCDAHITS